MRQPCRRGDTARGTSTDGAYRWLHAKPLYSAIGRVLAPYRPGGRHGHRRRRRRPKTQHKTQLFASVNRTFCYRNYRMISFSAQHPTIGTNSDNLTQELYTLVFGRKKTNSLEFSAKKK